MAYACRERKKVETAEAKAKEKDEKEKQVGSVGTTRFFLQQSRKILLYGW